MEWLLHGAAELFGFLHDGWLWICCKLAAKYCGNSPLVAKLLPWSVDAIVAAWFMHHGWFGWRYSWPWNWADRRWSKPDAALITEPAMPTLHQRPDGSWQELVTPPPKWVDCDPPKAPEVKPRARIVNPMQKPTSAGF
jgi:hypothetical protein